ncbi:54S ribosomal L7 protein [Rutstroemia sp. NJR-2017a WRK4]|nr:54S ribosomal L7 protein [Rutstroemia sp. NJR-2017a WRK4]PQE11855.1 54S ribosomal L7 protein [Rutstroemia sp. NJR-2017a WRK4]
MALREAPSTLCRFARRDIRSAATSIGRHSRRYASGEAAAAKEIPQEFEDLESQSSIASVEVPEDVLKSFDPIKRAKGRKYQLPPSRYQYRSPRYYRGPLHPHQPPPTSDPSSREFVPGPFGYNRLESTYKSTIAHDIMTMAYTHKPPGTVTVPKAERLRTWDDSSPYHKGRPKRGPRGPGEVLRLIERDITWQNVPKVEEITVHTMVKGALGDSAHLHVAGILLQAVTGVRPTAHAAKHNVATWGIRKGSYVSLTSTMRNNDALEFLDKVIHLVFPRIKDWKGVEGTTGDSSGNLMFGIDSEGTMLFPEVQVNYDMYPPRMIPGLHITVKTSATSDRHARLLLSAMGVPFYGKMVD